MSQSLPRKFTPVVDRLIQVMSLTHQSYNSLLQSMKSYHRIKEQHSEMLTRLQKRLGYDPDCIELLKSRLFADAGAQSYDESSRANRNGGLLNTCALRLAVRTHDGVSKGFITIDEE